MKTFIELYKEVTKGAVKGKLEETLKKLEDAGYSKNQLKCLTSPEDMPPVWKIKDCGCKDGKCIASCLFEAIKKDEDGKITINKNMCTACGECVRACDGETLVLSTDTVATLKLVKEVEVPTYALMAPAYIGQFGEDVTPGKLRSALKQIGFAGMIEVAAFADILTLKEALEFKDKIKKRGDYQLTSCCCPVWIALIRKKYSESLGHLTHSVSPMIAAGRVVKLLAPGCKTVFIGPCIAKKAESREDDVKGAIDCVITFKELEDIFEAAGINLKNMPDEEKEHSSAAGKIYAVAGGVSEAVKNAVERLESHEEIITCNACGVKECKELLDGILKGENKANFYEGMGCVGGCIGGPKVVKDRKQTEKNVREYVEKSKYKTPIDNPYVIDLLHRSGFETVEDFLKNSDIFKREF